MKKLFLLITLLVILLVPAKVFAGGITAPKNVRLVSIECGEYPKANATFTWDPVAYATSYRFYFKLADGTDTYRSYEDDPTTPGYTFIFNPTLDFYIGVSAINTSEPDVIPASSYETEKTEYFLSASKVLEICAQEAGKVLPTPESQVTPVTTLSPDEKKDVEKANLKVKELEKKLDSLENKVKETQKKQSFLEGLIQRILSFLHIGK